MYDEKDLDIVPIILVLPGRGARSKSASLPGSPGRPHLDAPHQSPKPSTIGQAPIDDQAAPLSPGDIREDLLEHRRFGVEEGGGSLGVRGEVLGPLGE